MKAEVLIKEGKTKIILRPENNFEIDLIENIESNKSKHELSIDVLNDFRFGENTNHRIEIDLIKKP